MADERCLECGESVVEGRLNCARCGAVYGNVADKELERNPQEQGS